MTALKQTTDIYRYPHKFYEPPVSQEFTLDDLRNLLRGKTWEWVVQRPFSASRCGPEFTGRMGCFLRRKAIAVCSQGMLVAMKFVVPNIYPAWTFEAVLDGGSHSGFVLLPGDFNNGRLGDVKLTDLVIADET